MVNGINNNESPYFKRREAISFNTKGKDGIGFIGFAGWSDNTNIKPFLTAFNKWLDNYKKNENLHKRGA
jgi:hypothetical protein